MAGDTSGRVAGIYISPDAAGPMRSVDSVAAVVGRGLEGDRYFAGEGSFSKATGEPHRHVTLIESEAIAAVNADYALEVDAGDTRRNVVTEGVALNHLVGREFTVGEVRLRGIKLCEPCNHLEEVSGKPLRKAFVHRGGLRAEILDGGTLSVGDPVEA